MDLDLTEGESPITADNLISEGFVFIGAAVALTIALAWSDFAKTAAKTVFGERDSLAGMLVYAIVITVVGVIIVAYIGRRVGPASKDVGAALAETVI